MDRTAPLRLFVFIVLITIGSLAFCIASDDMRSEQINAITTIENSYNIKLCYPSELSSNMHPSNLDKTKLTIQSLDPNDTSKYIVFASQKNGEWELSKRNDQGEYIPLDPAHTIQDLKEN